MDMFLLACIRGSPFHSVCITELLCRVNGRGGDFLGDVLSLDAALQIGSSCPMNFRSRINWSVLSP